MPSLLLIMSFLLLTGCYSTPPIQGPYEYDKATNIEILKKINAKNGTPDASYSEIEQHLPLTIHMNNKYVYRYYGEDLSKAEKIYSHRVNYKKISNNHYKLIYEDPERKVEYKIEDSGFWLFSESVTPDLWLWFKRKNEPNFSQRQIRSFLNRPEIIYENVQFK